MRRRGVRGWSLRVYLVVLVVIVAAVSGAAALVVRDRARDDARELALRDEGFTATQAAADVATSLQVLQGSVAQTAASPGIAGLFAAPGNCTLQFAGAGPFATGQLHVLRSNGALVCSSRPETGRADFVGAPWLAEASKGPVLLAPVEDPTTGEQMVLSAAPVPGQGIAVGSYDLASLGPGLASRFGGPREPEILVTSADGATVLARSIDPERWVGAPLAGTPFALGSGSSERPDVEGTERLYGTAEASGVGWRVHAGQDEGAALSAASSAFNEQLAIIIAGLILMLVTVLVLHRQVTRPIARLSRRVREASAGGAPEAITASGPAEVVGLAEDFNELMASVERELAARRESEETRLAILDTAADGIITTDERGTIESVNGAVERLFGYGAEELVGQGITMLMPEPLRPVHRAGLERYLATGEARILGTPGVEALALRRDGSTFPVHLSLAEIRLGTGRKFTGFVRDISERVAAEEQVRALNAVLVGGGAERTAELEAANAELEAFSYSVSHDLRSPLRSVSGFSSVLMEDHADALDPEVRGLLARIQAGAERMGTLIDDLLGLARLSRTEMHRQEVDLGELAARVAAGLAERDPGRHVEFRIAQDASAYGDPRLLGIVLDNLLGNAWKFTAKQPRAVVEFGALSDNGARAFFVRDNGAGFDMAYANKLFGPFQRLHHHDEFEGTGIGLATVQRIVRRHGGEVRAEGAVGAGATITFTIPDPDG